MPSRRISASSHVSLWGMSRSPDKSKDMKFLAVLPVSCLDSSDRQEW
jgi:hypothetical protein